MSRGVQLPDLFDVLPAREAQLGFERELGKMRSLCRQLLEHERREALSFLAHEAYNGKVVDFHALRMTFITNLTRSGVVPKTAQMLARHSDINLTMNTYTMLGVIDQAVAVEALPPIPARGGERES